MYNSDHSEPGLTQLITFAVSGDRDLIGRLHRARRRGTNEWGSLIILQFKFGA